MSSSLSNGINPEIPSLPKWMQTVACSWTAKHTPKKVRRCVYKCLYMSRFAPGSSHVRCSPISSRFHDAGTTNEYFILRAKDRRDLPWIWYLLNGSDFVQDYMNDMRAEWRKKRVKDDEFLAMPFRRPDDHIQKEAMECFAKALAAEQTTACTP